MSRNGGANGPPEASRFAKGRSGNPKGRPRGRKAKNISAFDIVIDKSLMVTQGGVERAVTVEEALQHQTYQAAIAGNRSARREVLKMIAKRERYLAGQKGPSSPKVEMRREIDPDNADAALLILGIATPNPARMGPEFGGGRLLLEPSAVQAAISRRRGGQKLTEKEKEEITRRTRNPDTLRWPRGGPG